MSTMSVDDVLRVAAIRAEANPRTKLLDLADLAALGRWELSKAKQVVKLRGFPKRVDLPGHPRWREAEVAKWMDGL